MILPAGATAGVAPATPMVWCAAFRAGDNIIGFVKPMMAVGTGQIFIEEHKRNHSQTYNCEIRRKNR